MFITILKVFSVIFCAFIPGTIAYCVIYVLSKKKNKPVSNIIGFTCWAFLPLFSFASIGIAGACASEIGNTTEETIVYNISCKEGTTTADIEWSQWEDGKILCKYNDGTEQRSFYVAASNVSANNNSENTVEITTFTYTNTFLDFMMGDYNSYKVSLTNQSLVSLFAEQ